MEINLRTDGPHSPAYTREVGSALEESVRTLNYATLGDAPGLEFPRDADRLLRDVVITLDRMPQLLEQVRRWMHAQYVAGSVGHDEGADVSRSVHIAERGLNTTAGHLIHAADALRTAAAETSHLTGIADDTTEGESTDD